MYYNASGDKTMMISVNNISRTDAYIKTGEMKRFKKLKPVLRLVLM